MFNLKTSAATTNLQKNHLQENQSYWQSPEAESLSFGRTLGNFEGKTQQQLDDIMSSSASAGGGIRN